MHCPRSSPTCTSGCWSAMTNTAASRRIVQSVLVQQASALASSKSATRPASNSCVSASCCPVGTSLPAPSCRLSAAMSIAVRPCRCSVSITDHSAASSLAAQSPLGCIQHRHPALLPSRCSVSPARTTPRRPRPSSRRCRPAPLAPAHQQQRIVDQMRHWLTADSTGYDNRVECASNGSMSDGSTLPSHR